MLGIPETDFVKLFEVVIQAGAICAVTILYFKDIITNIKLMGYLILSFIPTALAGLFFYDMIKGVFFESQFATTLVFIVVGIVFLGVEYLIEKEKIKPVHDIMDLSLKGAILIGVFQALAIVPGVSRAGAVLVGMMILGFKRSESAKYSFMLSIPTILAASLFDLIKMRDVLSAQTSGIPILVSGFLIAGVTAFFVVKWLISYLQTHTLVFFGWYRLIFGILLLVLFALNS